MENKDLIREITWYDFAKGMEEKGYDTMITFENDDDNENCVVCPECGEPIYEIDFNRIWINSKGNFICPICEFEL